VSPPVPASADLRVLLVDPAPPLGPALVQALLRLGARVTAFGGDLPPARGLVRLPGDRRRPGDLEALGPGDFDAAIDFGARDLEGPQELARVLRGRVGLVVQLGTWRVYAGAEDAPDCRRRRTPARQEPPMPVPCPEEAPKRDGSALLAEDGLWNARAGGDYPATVLRLACLYGPGVALAREWHVVGRLRAGRTRMALPDGGGQLLHRLYVDNAVHAVICALDHPQQADGRAFNVGDSRVPTLAELCAGCAAAAGRSLELVPLPRAVYDTHNPWAVPRPVVLDLHRLRARLGYSEPVPPEQALEQTVRWLWDLPEDEVLPTLDPYWRRFGCGHDYAAEEAALARWEAWCAGGAAQAPAW
jgi:nucleoside-diphosphate-sugar epimerase